VFIRCEGECKALDGLDAIEKLLLDCA